MKRSPEASSSSAPKLTIRPLTFDRWPDLEDLFGEKGACYGCWCMYWRIGAGYRGHGERNRRAFRNIVRKGPPPGLLAYAGDLAVGWCQLTPRDDLPVLDRLWRLRRVDDQPVWAISCFYVRIGYRRKGISSALIAAAIKAARRARAPALEAYPLDGKVSPSATGTGYLSTFRRAGFEVVLRRSPPRPIVRFDLTPRALEGEATPRPTSASNPL